MADETTPQENQEESSDNKKSKEPGGGKGAILYLSGMLFMSTIAVLVVVIMLGGQDKSNAGAPPQIAANEVAKTIEESSGKSGGEKTTEIKTTEEALYDFEPLVVNTADADVLRYISVKAHLVFNNETQKSILDESLVCQAQIRDLMISTLSTKTANELRSQEVKKELKAGIIKELNSTILDGFMVKAGMFKEEPVKVKAIYFSDYIIQ